MLAAAVAAAAFGLAGAVDVEWLAGTGIAAAGFLIGVVVTMRLTRVLASERDRRSNEPDPPADR